MICSSCVVKCGNKHCPEKYTIVEACRSGKSFHIVGDSRALIYHEENGFRFVYYKDTGKVFNVTNERFMAEYALI